MCPNAVQASLPFAVVGSEFETGKDGVSVRTRRYPWGIVDSKSLVRMLPSMDFELLVVEDPKVSDFARVKAVLLRYVVVFK